jgi:CspA family cold shock protein
MPAGVVKNWFIIRGFGFITSEDGEDFFVHQSDIQTSGPFRALIPNMRVEFQIGAGKKGRKKAVQVTGPNGTAIRLFPESEALEATGPPGKQKAPPENPPKGSKGSQSKAAQKKEEKRARQIARLKLLQIKQPEMQKKAKLVALKEFKPLKKCSATECCARNETDVRQHALKKAFHKQRAMEYLDDWDTPLV